MPIIRWGLTDTTTTKPRGKPSSETTARPFTPQASGALLPRTTLPQSETRPYTPQSYAAHTLEPSPTPPPHHPTKTHTRISPRVKQQSRVRIARYSLLAALRGRPTRLSRAFLVHQFLQLLLLLGLFLGRLRRRLRRLDCRQLHPQPVSSRR
jgi:hypothetical protein